MSEIKNAQGLAAVAQAFYDAVREAAIEYAKKPFDNRNRLDKTFILAARIAALNGLDASPLPIPKSIVQGAPQITTPAALKAKKTPAPPPPSGDVLADNAPKPKRRTSKKRSA